MLIQGSESTAKTSQGTMTLPTTSGSVGGTGFYGTTTSSKTTSYNIKKPGYKLNVFYFEDKPSGKYLEKSLFDVSEEIVRLRRKHRLD